MSCTDEMFYVEIMTERKGEDKDDFTVAKSKINSSRSCERFLCASLVWELRRLWEEHRVLLLNFTVDTKIAPRSPLSFYSAHKMHILKIKRKFVSYLLCSMGIFIFFLRFSSLLLSICQYNKEGKFILSRRIKRRHLRRGKLFTDGK